MKVLLFSDSVFKDGRFIPLYIVIDGGVIKSVADAVPTSAFDKVFDFTGCYIFPGFSDVHVHTREPGFSYKDTLKNTSISAAFGGYTRICAMPNLNPVPDSVEHLQQELDIIRRDACIDVIPYGAVTVGEKGEVLSDFDGMSKYIFALSDDGRGVQSPDIMKKAMQKAHGLGLMICAHCEVNDYLHGGFIHDGSYAKSHNYNGISSASEYEMVARDIALAEKTGARYHVCHISCRESVNIIRQAKAEGVNVTCETAPHYLLLCEDDLKDDGSFKMNPPLRSSADRDALIEGIKDGTVDMIATDHAPHSAEEKSNGLEKSPFGIVGLECAFPTLYTGLVRKGIITLEKLTELISINPREKFGLPSGINVGSTAELCVFDTRRSYNINSDNFKSAGKSTPFDKMNVYGKHIATFYKESIFCSQ